MKSIVQTGDTKCFYCHMAIGAETHHIFGGPNRRLSDKDGLTVRLCRQCHDELHNDKNRSEPMQKALHELGQTKWEEHYGPGLALGGKDPRQEFLKRYGRNYL